MFKPDVSNFKNLFFLLPVEVSYLSIATQVAVTSVLLLSEGSAALNKPIIGLAVLGVVLFVLQLP